MTVTNIPTFSGFVDQKLVLEPLVGPIPPARYTERFPDELYHKAPESHLIRFLTTILGPSGIGWLRKNTLDARLELEGSGLELFDLDRFYGDPFRFGRIADESYVSDPTGVLEREEWEFIKASDESYRSRAIDFMNAARAGNTVLGMRLAARSGIGHEAEIVENFRYLFDSHSDDPLGLTKYGSTNTLGEFIVLPRQELPRNEEQTITITGDPTSGNFVLWFNGRNTPTIPWNASLFEVQTALESIPTIGPNNVKVRGGPGPNNPWTVRFIAELGGQNTPTLTAEASFSGGTNPAIAITTSSVGKSSVDETYHISPRNHHSLQIALDRLRPVDTIPTIYPDSGRRQAQTWLDVVATSEFNEVVRYVTGNPAIKWPEVDTIHWIEKNKEKEARRVAKDLQYHYVGFHNISKITASSEHIGRFNDAQRKHGHLYLTSDDDTLIYSADRSTADYFEPLVVTSLAGTGENMINGVYPEDALESPSAPQIKYAEEQFWASAEAPSGSEYLEIDLGTVRAVNYLVFEVARKPLSLSIMVDGLDLDPRRRWLPVSYIGEAPNSLLHESNDPNPWIMAEYRFEDDLGRTLYTRFVRIEFERQDTGFLFNAGVQSPWSIEVRNLRIGRNASDY